MANQKGQWLMISAVVISTVFLVISTTFLSYFGAESSTIAIRDEDHIFNNIKDQLNNLIASSDCTQSNMNEFIAFVKQEYEQQGYVIEIQADCSSLTSLVVKSDTVTIEYSP